jgi:hypothetical protein
MRTFQRDADRIIHSTRLPQERGYDVERAALGARASAFRDDAGRGADNHMD